MHKSAVFASFIALIFCGSAYASNITELFDVNGLDYVRLFSAEDANPSPIDPAQIEFTVTFDPLTKTYPTSFGLHILYSNLPSADFPVQFSYDPRDVLTLATKPGLDSFGDPADSFGIFIDSMSSTPTLDSFTQTTSTGTIWGNQRGSVVATVVPEPAAWSLLLVGVGSLGAAVRSRRNRSRVACPTVLI